MDGVETGLGPEVEFFLRGVNLPCLGPKLRSRLISRDEFSQNLFSIGDSTPEIARVLSREQAYPLALAEAMTKVTDIESPLFRRQLSPGKSAQFPRSTSSRESKIARIAIAVNEQFMCEQRCSALLSALARRN